MMVNEHPAYLKWANTTDRASLRKWLESQTYSDGYYTNKPKFIVSSLKEWFGENATVDNDYGYDWWPKVPSETGAVDYTHISTFELMQQGVIKGYFNWGMNPAIRLPTPATCAVPWPTSIGWSSPTRSSPSPPASGTRRI